MKTKLLLGDTIERLLEKKPLDELTVKEIIDTAGVSKQTFYRHFKDKYDLANWRFVWIEHQVMSEITLDMDFVQSRIKILSALKKKKKFIKALFMSSDANSFREFSISHLKNDYYAVLKANGYDMSDREMIFAVDTWVCGESERFRLWILEGCDTPIETIAKSFDTLMPQCIKECFEKENFCSTAAKVHRGMFTDDFGAIV